MALNESIRNALIAVGTTALEISPQVPQGRYTVRAFKNTSTGGQIITVSPNSDAVANVGIVLNPSETWVESTDSGFEPTNVRISAVSSAAAGQISIHERIRN